MDLNDLKDAFGLRKLQDIFAHGQLSAEFDKSGIWAVDSKNHCIVRQRNPGKDTVGDVRVSYQVLNQFEMVRSGHVQASVCGVPQGNRIVRWPKLTSSVMSGTLTKDKFLEKRVI